MPYEVIMNAENCDGHAVVKVGEMVAIDGGCHSTHEEALAQLAALNMSYDADADADRAAKQDPPDYMRANAARGLELHEEGKSGGGVVPQTIEDARAMAAGEVSERKWRKIGPWIARHMVDLEAKGVAEGEITAGVVAHLLWGSGASKSAAERTMDYANSVVSHLDKEHSMTDKVEAPARAEADDLSVGDLCRWSASGGTAYGRIETKATDGSIKAVPRGPTMEGTPEEPAFLTRVFVFDGEEWSRTEVATVHRAAALTKIDDFPERSARNKWVSTDKNGKRVGYSTTEVRAIGDGNTLVGYAAVFDSDSEPLPFIETVSRGAFAKTLDDRADVRLLIDHEGVPLARTTSGTMRLTEDERGLKVEADLDPANPDAARVISALRRGDLSQMSFAFDAVRDSWSADGQRRELQEVRLYDVSVVTFPAYEDTVAEVRRLCEQRPPMITKTTRRRWARVIQIMKARTSGGSK